MCQQLNIIDVNPSNLKKNNLNYQKKIISNTPRPQIYSSMESSLPETRCRCTTGSFGTSTSLGAPSGQIRHRSRPFNTDMGISMSYVSCSLILRLYNVAPYYINVFWSFRFMACMSLTFKKVIQA